jgi:hypothetical protein
MIAPWDGPMLIAPPPDGAKEAGEGQPCDTDQDCEPQLFCDTPMCIVACPARCVKHPCAASDPPCPTGSQCVTSGVEALCVRK